MTVTAIYQGGVLHPTEPLPLADGTAVEVDVRTPAPAELPSDDPVLVRLRALYAARGLPPPVIPDPEQVNRRMQAIMELPEEPTGDPTVTGRDHDRVLYGGPKGAR